MNFNIIIKDLANIVYDKEKRIFLVKYNVEELTIPSIERVLDLYKQLVDAPVVFIHDIRNVKTFNRDLRRFINQRLSQEKLLALLLVTPRSLPKVINNYINGLSKLFNSEHKIKVFYSLEKALAQANHPRFNSNYD